MRINIPENSKIITDSMQSKRKKVTSTFKKLMNGSKFRQDQLETILAIVMAIEDGFTDIILRAPTGSGKSSIAMTVAKIYQPFYLLSQSLSLTQQYKEDFIFLTEILGRNNFLCEVDYVKADKAQCLKVKKFSCPQDIHPIPFIDACGEKRNMIHRCDYWNCKYDNMLSSEVLTTPWYLFRETQGRYSQFAKRKIAIYDEAHDLPDNLSTIIEEYWSKKNHDVLKNYPYPIPPFPNLDNPEDWRNYLTDIKTPLIDIEIELEGYLEKEKDYDHHKKISEELNEISGLRDKAEDILLLLEKEDHILITKKVYAKNTVFYFKPVKATPFARRFIDRISDVRIFMSATILPDILKEELNLDDDKTMFISVNRSSFPVENRRIYAVNVAQMHKKKWKENMPKIRNFITSILDLPRFKDKNALILAPSYQLCTLAEEELQPYFNGKILSYKSSKEREKVVERFRKERGLILLGPSLFEGFDFKDDICRVIFLLKTPIPYLGDPVVRKRILIDENDYRSRVNDSCGYRPPSGDFDKCENFACSRPCQRWSDGKVVLGIEQGLGRGVRHEKDWCYLFILDSNFGHFYAMKEGMFSTTFREAYQKVENREIKKFLKNI